MTPYISDRSLTADHESSLEPFHKPAFGALTEKVKSTEGFVLKIERDLTTLHEENSSLRKCLATSERSRQEMCDLQSREKEALLRQIDCKKKRLERTRQQKEAYSRKLEERIAAILAEKKDVEEFHAEAGEQQIAALKKEVEAMISPYIWPK